MRPYLIFMLVYFVERFVAWCVGGQLFEWLLVVLFVVLVLSVELFVVLLLLRFGVRVVALFGVQWLPPFFVFVPLGIILQGMNINYGKSIIYAI